MTEAQANALVATILAAWPRQQIGTATLDIYAHDLADLDYTLAAQAVETVRRTAMFFPSIAEIRAAAAEIQLAAPSPMLAWEHASTRGARHPLVQQARNVVGDDWAWRTEPAGSLRRAFLAAYSEVRAEAVRDLQLGRGMKELTA